MSVDVYNLKGEKTKTINPGSIFKTPINPNLLYLVYHLILSNRRKPLAHTKDRSEVRGGGRKPWRQKGTGRSRHGSIRSPLWIKGGVTFGPRKEKNYQKKINTKAKEKALKMALSSKYQDKELMVIEDPSEIAKTKQVAEILAKLTQRKKTLVVLAKGQNKLVRFFRNIPYVNVNFENNLDLVEILNRKYLIFTESAFKNYLK